MSVPAPGPVRAPDHRAVVLVEGESDREALLALARLRGRDLAADGVAVLAMGGITNVGHFLDRLCVPGSGVAVAGLYDAGEERHVRRHLARTGIGTAADRAGLEALGFFVCDLDLEDELIRALGVAAVEGVVAAQGELGSLRTLRRQPAQRDRTAAAQLHRFLGSRGGRKVHYARLLVEALDPDRVPRPLDAVLERVLG
ncbi:TOPRIM nucleotidyl transferase/hydrolase domain-containing protein [Pseudonocardia lacus]|uniref:TOPRIM nucleotidyl transferase/hydrolase domain-containing protein n=1 Tax=Pseudonocardia lacus TaxID=2835865 RepID=UPI001BDC58F3|nr:TOPRIM nucleotidyl transferase/hydrolase domain-containing protein [Pseudonocardia lacus]